MDILDWEPEEDQVDLPENWKYKRGWHGTTLYAVAGLLRNRIASSCSKEEDHRFFEACPGIYLYKDATARKASNYVTYSWLPGRLGCFRGIVVEVVCDRLRKVEVDHPDQWIQKPGSVKMKALWVHGCNNDTMSSESWLWHEWLPSYEFPEEFSISKVLKGIPDRTDASRRESS